jgi:hypothetical protein
VAVGCRDAADTLVLEQGSEGLEVAKELSENLVIQASTTSPLPAQTQYSL